MASQADNAKNTIDEVLAALENDEPMAEQPTANNPKPSNISVQRNAKSKVATPATPTQTSSPVASAHKPNPNPMTTALKEVKQKAAMDSYIDNIVKLGAAASKKLTRQCQEEALAKGDTKLMHTLFNEKATQQLLQLEEEKSSKPAAKKRRVPNDEDKYQESKAEAAAVKSNNNNIKSTMFLSETVIDMDDEDGVVNSLAVGAVNAISTYEGCDQLAMASLLEAGRSYHVLKLKIKEDKAKGINYSMIELLREYVKQPECPFYQKKKAEAVQKDLSPAKKYFILCRQYPLFHACTKHVKHFLRNKERLTFLRKRLEADADFWQCDREMVRTFEVRTEGGETWDFNITRTEASVPEKDSDESKQMDKDLDCCQKIDELIEDGHTADDIEKMGLTEEEKESFKFEYGTK